MTKLRLITLSLCLLAAAGASAAKVDGLRQQAQSLYRDGRYAEAAEVYRKMVARAENDPAVLKEVMWAHWNMQQFEEAEHVARQVAALQPKDVEARNILAWAPKAANREKMHELKENGLKNYQAGRFEQAAELYGQLAELDPDNIS